MIVINVPNQAKSCFPPAATIPKCCSYCDKAPEIICHGCNVMMWCSPNCRSQERETHQLVCSQYHEVDDGQRPDKDHFRALWFPAHDNRPQWIWLRTRRTRLGGRGVPASSLEERLGTIPEKWQPVHKGGFYNGLVHGLAMLFDTAFLKKQPGRSSDQPNKSIAELAPPGYMRPYWSSPLIVAYREYGRRNTVVIEDLNMSDFRKIIDAFHTRSDNPCVVIPKRFYTKLIQHAVKINSVGDRRFFHLSPAQTFQQVDIPLNPCGLGLTVGSVQWACPLAVKCGLPWLCRRLSTDQSYTAEGLAIPEIKPHSLALRWRELGNPQAGVVRMMEPGTLFVAHMLGAPIHTSHVQVFIKAMRIAPLRTMLEETSEKLKNSVERLWNLEKGHNKLTDVPSPWEVTPEYTRQDLGIVGVEWNFDLDMVERINGAEQAHGA